jgi:hypothetical protein
VFCHQNPTGTCGRSNLAVRSFWDNVAWSVRATIKLRGAMVTASIKAVGS